MINKFESLGQFFLLIAYALVLVLSIAFVSSTHAAGFDEIPDITLSWSNVDTKENGEPVKNLTEYRLYHSLNNSEEETILISSDETEHTLVDVAYGVHSFQITAVEVEDGKELEGKRSQIVTVTATKPESSPPGRVELRATIELCVNGECSVQEVN